MTTRQLTQEEIDNAQEMFEVILMYSEKNARDMWWVMRVKDAEGRPDYYGPWFDKKMAEKFLGNEL